MSARLVLAACALAALSAWAADVLADKDAAAKRKQRYLELTEGWAREMELTRAEQQVTDTGRQLEPELMNDLEDRLASRVMTSGEPSFEAFAATYPGKVLDRTVLGTYSDPRQPNPYSDEFVIWFNGAISANLQLADLGEARQGAACNTNVVFRIGPHAEMYGKAGGQFSRIGYEDGYLPIVVSTYESEGVRYRQTAFAHQPSRETRGWDVAFVRFELSNPGRAPRTAMLHTEVVLIDGGTVKAAEDRILDAAGAALLTYSTEGAQFDAAKRRLVHRFELQPGQTAAVYLKIPYLPDKAGLIRAAGRASFDAAHGAERTFWTKLIGSGTQIEIGEERVNNVWRALLAQNYILADGPRFTYGSGLRYNDSYYPFENGFGAHTFAMYGHEDYANALLPHALPPSVEAARAGRKYQNRRAIPFHHLLENYRLTGKLDTFHRYKDELYRVAEEIVSDRRTTMKLVDGKRPLHWGLLPPDKPAVDLRASTRTVYVLGHNITNCQGLRDFGELLVRSGIDPQRGQRYLSEAREFRKDILMAMERAAVRLPDRPPFVDLQTLYFRETPDYGPQPYDHLASGRLQGTYFHYWVEMEFMYNFFNPDDAPGRWLADYVQQRGGFVLGCTRARQRPDSPYAWINNVYNAGYYLYRLRANDIARFLVGLYSRLAFGMSRHVYVASEGSPFLGYNTRNGGFVSADYSFPNSAANAETLWMLRSALILEELRDNVETGVIHIMPGAPRAWLAPGRQIRVTNAGTYFGRMSFTIRSEQKRIAAQIQAPQRAPFREMIVSFRSPAAGLIRGVRVNGRPHTVYDSFGRVRLPYGPKVYDIEVSY